jgi:endonuclease G
MARRRRNQPDDFGQPDFRDLRPMLDLFRRLDRRAQLLVVAVVLVAASVALFLYWRSHQPHGQAGPTTTTATTPGPANVPASPSASAGVQMLLGNPSGATPDPANKNNYLMPKPYYALSYNNATGTPNWVSWRVTRADLGDAPRKRIFDPDSELPPGFYHVTSRDYSGSGFDRGHMCPHSDRAANEQMSFATFVMTNIIPQAPNVNQKAWADLEEYCREQVYSRGDRLYVISGPAGRGGTGLNGPRETIANGKVTVPAECWKIVVEVPASGGDDDLRKINTATRVIAVLMPNNNDSVGYGWANYRTTPAAIEQKTGLRFFDRLPPDVAEALRRKLDTTYVRPPQPRNRGTD